MGVAMIGHARRGTALVTGASGFIGRHLRDALLEAEIDVVSLRRPNSPASTRGRSASIDYADTDGLCRLMDKERPRYVFHVAGATKGVTYRDFFQANVMPTQNLLAALRTAHPCVERFVHISSLTAFGPSTYSAPHTEASTPRPIEFYGKSKLEAEQVVEGQGTAIPWTILRPGGVYGPGDVDYLQLFKTVARGINIFFGNRDRQFSAVYVDDLVQAILAVAATDSSRNRGYFVCDGTPVTWGEFQELIVRASGRRVRTLNLPEFLVDASAIAGEILTRLDKKPRLFNRQKAIMGAQDAWTCRHDALAADAGYRPTVSTREGVDRTLAWYRRERWL